jgi:hypothetical protein
LSYPLLIYEEGCPDFIGTGWCLVKKLLNGHFSLHLFVPFPNQVRDRLSGRRGITLSFYNFKYENI